MLSTSPSSFLEHYKSLVASGAIEADPAQPRRILTVCGRGYRLVAREDAVEGAAEPRP